MWGDSAHRGPSWHASQYLGKPVSDLAMLGAMGAPGECLTAWAWSDCRGVVGRQLGIAYRVSRPAVQEEVSFYPQNLD